MSIRYLIAAAFLFGSACGAQADVLRGAGQSGLLTSWNGKGVQAVASNYVAPAASHGGVVDGAPSPDWNTHGNGATVITPPQSGQAGGAIVTLPTPAQGNGPVSAPSQTEAAAVPEPSSIALMMAGMMGALGIARRRKR